MFTINLGDGCEAPSKARKNGAKCLEFLVLIYLIYKQNGCDIGRGVEIQIFCQAISQEDSLQKCRVLPGK